MRKRAAKLSGSYKSQGYWAIQLPDGRLSRDGNVRFASYYAASNRLQMKRMPEGSKVVRVVSDDGKGNVAILDYSKINIAESQFFRGIESGAEWDARIAREKAAAAEAKRERMMALAKQIAERYDSERDKADDALWAKWWFKRPSTDW